MACKDCLQNCPQIISDKCVEYTGPDIPALGICTGDSLSKFEAAVVEKLLATIEGTGITPADVTVETCAYLKEQLGTKAPTLSNLLQLLIDAQCSLKTLVDTLVATPSTFDTGCLTGLADDATHDDILQATVTLLCSLKGTVDGLPNVYVKISDLTTLVNNIIGGVNSNYYTRMVPYVVYPYEGPLSNFDNTGKGLTSAGFNKVYICNGLNGTKDYRGRALVGAVRNVPGGTLDTAVDPVNPINPNTNYAVGDKFGENYHQTTISEIPNHSHSVVDPGHTHQTGMYQNDSSGGNQQNNAYFDANQGATPRSFTTQSNTTGITVASVGGGQAHNVRQPSIAVNYIIYIP